MFRRLVVEKFVLAFGATAAVAASCLLLVRWHRSRSRDGDFWWKIATTFLFLAVAGVIAETSFEISQPANILGPNFYADLSGLGTFVAALAAWCSVLASRRADQRKSSTQTTNSASDGVDEAEFRLMTEMLRLMTDGTLNAEQMKQLQGMASALLAIRSEPTTAASASNSKHAHREEGRSRSLPGTGFLHGLRKKAAAAR
jgi:hypothetical protein